MKRVKHTGKLLEKDTTMSKNRYVIVKDPNCKDINDIRDSYSGLWNYLKLERISRRDDNGANCTKGYMLRTKKRIYKLEPSGS